MKNVNIPDLKDRIKPIAKKFDLKLAILFGSIARGKTRPDSDIDIAIVTDTPVFNVPDMYMNFMASFEDIENYYRRNIDLIEINSTNIALLKHILMDGLALYEYRWHYYALQRLHWRFLVEDNYRFARNYSKILSKKLKAL
jgi:predicted nucleotidyltransferase